MEAIDTFDVEQLTVEIHHDDIQLEFIDELTFDNDEDSDVIVCSFNTRSVLAEQNPFEELELLFEFSKKNDMVIFNLWKYEHGQVAYRAGVLGEKMGYPFGCQFDSGIEGLVMVKSHVSWSDEEPIDRANRKLDLITDWVNGSIYGFIIKDDDGEELDSCWGFLGSEYVKEAATEQAQCISAYLPKQLEMSL
jgi:hypothetical protein